MGSGNSQHRFTYSRWELERNEFDSDDDDDVPPKTRRMVAPKSTNKSGPSREEEIAHRNKVIILHILSMVAKNSKSTDETKRIHAVQMLRVFLSTKPIKEQKVLVKIMTKYNKRLCDEVINRDLADALSSAGFR